MCGGYVDSVPSRPIRPIQGTARSVVAVPASARCNASQMQAAVDKVFHWYVSAKQRAGTDVAGDTYSYPISDRGSKNPLGVLLGRVATRAADLENDDAVNLLVEEGYCEDFLWDLLGRHDEALDAGSFRTAIRDNLIQLAVAWDLQNPARVR